MGLTNERDWTPGETPPSDSREVWTMNSRGDVTTLRFKDGLWFFPDYSMYVYYIPQFWKDMQHD